MINYHIDNYITTSFKTPIIAEMFTLKPRKYYSF